MSQKFLWVVGLAVTLLGSGCAHLRTEGAEVPSPGMEMEAEGETEENPTHKVICVCACRGEEQTFDVPPSECKALNGAECRRSNIVDELGNCHLRAVKIE